MTCLNQDAGAQKWPASWEIGHRAGKEILPCKHLTLVNPQINGMGVLSGNTGPTKCHKCHNPGLVARCPLPRIARNCVQSCAYHPTDGNRMSEFTRDSAAFATMLLHAANFPFIRTRYKKHRNETKPKEGTLITIQTISQFLLPFLCPFLCFSHRGDLTKSHTAHFRPSRNIHNGTALSGVAGTSGTITLAPSTPYPQKPAAI